MGSTRLPGKPLQDICGKPLIIRVIEGVSCSSAVRTAVATDSREILECVESAGYEAVLTGPAVNGTERVHQAWRIMGEPGDTIINIQGDEPGADGSWIEALSSAEIPCGGVATLATPVPALSVDRPSAVTVAIGSGNRAMYFSRQTIPWGAETVFRHTGAYCFTPASLPLCAECVPGPISFAEGLEQLAWMESGVPVVVVTGEWNGTGVDTPEDLEGARKWFLNR